MWRVGQQSDCGKTQIFLLWDKCVLPFHGSSCKHYLTYFALLFASLHFCRLLCAGMAQHLASSLSLGRRQWNALQGYVCSRHHLEFPTLLSASSIASHWTFTNYSIPQEKHLLPEWRAYLLLLSKRPWFCGSIALHSRSCCHYTRSRRLLSNFWCFLLRCLMSCRFKWQ